MKPENVKTGFNRIGVVFAAACFVLAAFGIGSFIAELATYGEENTGSLLFGLGSLLAGVASFVLARLLGWIIAGFAGG